MKITRKMLESRPKGVLETLKTVHTEETVETVETENLRKKKKYDSLLSMTVPTSVNDHQFRFKRC